MANFTLDNTQDIIDVSDIIERVEELREQKTHIYIVGFNMPGYLPDAEPMACESADDARAALAEIMRNHAEENANCTELLAAADSLELESEDEESADYGATICNYHYFISYQGIGGLDDDETEELEQLEELLSELQGMGGDEQFDGDWYPSMLIRDSYFEDYAQELAEDCGMVNVSAAWPNNCIDWEKAAQELQYDYSSVEIDGVTYWTR